MNSKPLLIAIACGLATAVLLVAPLRLGGLGTMLVPFALLPTCVAILGLGTRFGLISGAVTAMVMALAVAPAAGIAVFALTLLPALWAGHMAGLSRDDDGVVEWFPISTILYRLALVCAACVLVMGAMTGFSAEGGPAMLEDMYRTMFEQLQASGGTVPTESDLEELAARMASLIPLVMPASLLIMYVINLYLGARIARSQGWMLRPADDLRAETALPLAAVGIFAIGVVGMFASGNIGLIATVIAGAMGAAFMLVGFAVLHWYLRDNPARRAILFATYACSIFFLFPPVIMAVIGLAETLLGLRGAASTPTQGPGNGSA